MCKSWRRWRRVQKFQNGDPHANGLGPAIGSPGRVVARFNAGATVVVHCSAAPIYSPSGLLAPNFITNTLSTLLIIKLCTHKVYQHIADGFQGYVHGDSKADACGKRCWWQSECHFVSVPTSDFEPLSETEFPWFFASLVGYVHSHPRIRRIIRYPVDGVETVRYRRILDFFFLGLWVTMIVGKILEPGQTVPKWNDLFLLACLGQITRIINDSDLTRSR